MALIIHNLTVKATIDTDLSSKQKSGSSFSEEEREAFRKELLQSCQEMIKKYITSRDER